MSQIKLNLNALKQNTAKKEEKKDLNINNKEDIKNKNIENITKQENIDNKKEEILPLYSKKIKSPVDKIVETKLNFNSIQEKQDKEELKNQEKKDIEINIEINNKEDNNKEFFLNYESDFTQEKKKIGKKIKELKNFVKPKTRLGFIFSIIGITFLGIASLFIIDPKTHNLQNYKANLINIGNKIECKINKKNCKKQKKTIQQNIKKNNKINNNTKKQKEKVKIDTKILKLKEYFKKNKKLQKYFRNKKDAK